MRPPGPRWARAGVLRAGAVAAAAIGLAGCGGGIMSPDVFEVLRSGNEPGARLDLVVNDGGTVRCNRAQAVAVTDPELIQARNLQTQLQPYAQQGLTLPPGPASVLRYSVRDGDGQVSFSDDSVHQPPVL